MAWYGSSTRRNNPFLLHAVATPRRSSRLSASTRSPVAGTDRAHADRLRARRLPARLVDAVGYSLHTLHQAGLVTTAGYDAYKHRLVFPLEGNLYGRSISAT